MASSMSTPLVFTPEVMSRVDPKRHHSGPLLCRWAGEETERGAAVRAQIERIAALVPEFQRARVLGPVIGRSSSDDQVRDAVGGLLLAAVLSKTGWDVEHEPQVDGGTPDFRISKGDRTYLVELKRVTGKLENSPQDAAIARIRDAIAPLPETRTPISIRHAVVSGQASLKPLIEKLREALALAQPGVKTIAYQGVAVTFEIHEAFDFDMPVVLSWGQRIAMGSETDLVRNAVNEKLGRYKQPLIVALDLVGLGDGFRAATDALLGNEVYRVPVDLESTGKKGVVTVARLEDGVLAGNSNDALRARNRLVATLSFEWRPTAEGPFGVEAKLLANPATTPTHDFSEFAPMPRLVVVRKEHGLRELRYQTWSGNEQALPDTIPSWSATP